MLEQQGIGVAVQQMSACTRQDAWPGAEERRMADMAAGDLSSRAPETWGVATLAATVRLASR